MFNGLGMGLGSLSRLSNAETRSISPENITGGKGCGGALAEGSASYAARDLGRGWKVNPYFVLEPGETKTLADIEGPGAIQSIWMTGIKDRYMILRIYWDGQTFPSVETPACDFFAFGWAKNVSGTDMRFPTLTSVPVMVAPNRGLSCFWEMPFRKKCTVTLENISDEKRNCYYQINYTLTEVPDDAAYFHASFRRTNPIGYKDVYTVIDGIEGKGHYVGTALSVGLNGANG